MGHYENPLNVGSLDKAANDVGTGLVGAPACGDVMKLQIKVNEDGVVEDAVFKTFGCGSAIASSSCYGMGQGEKPGRVCYNQEHRDCKASKPTPCEAPLQHACRRCDQGCHWRLQGQAGSKRITIR